MIDIHPKYDNMHKNGMIYALIFINNHIIININCMLSTIQVKFARFVHELATNTNTIKIFRASDHEVDFYSQ